MCSVYLTVTQSTNVYFVLYTVDHTELDQNEKTTTPSTPSSTTVHLVHQYCEIVNVQHLVQTCTHSITHVHVT